MMRLPSEKSVIQWEVREVTKFKGRKKERKTKPVRVQDPNASYCMLKETTIS